MKHENANVMAPGGQAVGQAAEPYGCGPRGAARTSGTRCARLVPPVWIGCNLGLIFLAAYSPRGTTVNGATPSDICTQVHIRFMLGVPARPLA